MKQALNKTKIFTIIQQKPKIEFNKPKKNLINPKEGGKREQSCSKQITR